jgi:Fe-S cluster biogenesis protein NfuA/nitrite reductase/ring-hydroxylating ferredoxin subunit
VAIGAEAPAPEQLVARVQQLTEALEAVPDPFARGIAEDLVGAVLELYGEGLGRIFAALGEAGESGEAIRAELSRDGVVASLLLIHGLYPVDLRTRVLEALDSVRPYMNSHGGGIELLSLDDGVARLRLEGSCSGCAASQATLETAIEQALAEAAPDLMGLEVEGVVEAQQPPVGAFELPMVQVAEPGWHKLPPQATALPAGELAAIEVGGGSLLVANVGGSLLAYRDGCVACGATLHTGRLQGGVLHCSGCGHRFYLPGAGRSLDGDKLQIDPVPLLPAEDGGFKVALT